MSNKINIPEHKRSTPNTPPYKGPGNKPGPKPVRVEPHKRSKPNK